VTIGRPTAMERKIRWQVKTSRKGKEWGVWCGICQGWEKVGETKKAAREGVRAHRERHLREKEFMEASGLGGIAGGKLR